MADRNLKATTVLGDTEHMKLIKETGGNLSEAFRIGCEIYLGVSSKDLGTLKQELQEVQEKLLIMNAKKAALEAKIQELESTVDPIEEVVDRELEKTVEEFIRCSPAIMYKKQLQMISYLAKISGKPNQSIKEFMDRRTEPTDEEIRAFLRG